MFSFSTLPELFIESFNSNSRQKALQIFSQDGFRSYTSSNVKTRVTHLALGLITLGLKRGERVGITALPSPDWLMVDIAIQIAGGVSVPIFKKIAPQSFIHEVRDSGMKILFIDNEHEYQKSNPYVKRLRHIITFCYSGEHPEFEALLKAGEARAQEHPDEFEKLVALVKPSDLATIIYTSGSTGLPKGVQLSQGNIVSQVYATSKLFDIRHKNSLALSFLPLAHIFERMVVYFYLASQTPISFIDDPKSIGVYIKEIKPTVFTVVPRILEKVYIKMKQGAASYGGLKTKIAQAAIRRAETKDEKQKPRIRDKIYDALVYKKMREGLGGNIKLVISGSARLDPNLGRFFINIGLPLYEGYGMTESSPVIAANYHGHRKLGTVGQSFPDVQIKIEHGEVLVKGPNVMQGYYNMPQETAQTITQDGWLHTGDLGTIDDEGYLTITGRKKELFKKSTGEYVAPVPIEQRLGKIDGIDIAVVFAENRPYVIALFFPDMEEIPQLKARIASKEMSDEAFLASSEMRYYIQEHIKTINMELHHTERIEKFHILDHGASIDRGELTSTMKARRFTIEEMYKDNIEELYK